MVYENVTNIGGARMELNYDNLLEAMLQRSVRFREAYDIEIKKDNIDKQSGMHTVFSLVFVPLFIKAIKENDQKLISELALRVEEMERSDDVLVQEVSGFTIIEALCDEFNNDVLSKVLLNESKKTMEEMREYIPER